MHYLVITLIRHVFDYFISYLTFSCDALIRVLLARNIKKENVMVRC
jgi:hypothetical protein